MLASPPKACSRALPNMSRSFASHADFVSLLLPFVASSSQITRTPTAIGATLKTAGSVHPHKLCTALLRIALDPKTSSASSFELQSWTPVKSFTPLSGEGKESWKVETVGSKGSVEAGMVVLCSNAHTAHLFEKGDDDFKKQ